MKDARPPGVEPVPADPYSEKTRLNRLRRRAASQGLTISRTRRYDRLAQNYGLMSVLNGTGAVLFETKSVDELEQFVLHPEDRPGLLDRAAPSPPVEEVP